MHDMSEKLWLFKNAHNQNMFFIYLLNNKKKGDLFLQRPKKATASTFIGKHLICKRAFSLKSLSVKLKYYFHIGYDHNVQYL